MNIQFNHSHQLSHYTTPNQTKQITNGMHPSKQQCQKHHPNTQKKKNHTPIRTGRSEDDRLLCPPSPQSHPRTQTPRKQCHLQAHNSPPVSKQALTYTNQKLTRPGKLQKQDLAGANSDQFISWKRPTWATPLRPEQDEFRAAHTLAWACERRIGGASNWASGKKLWDDKKSWELWRWCTTADALRWGSPQARHNSLALRLARRERWPSLPLSRPLSLSLLLISFSFSPLRGRTLSPPLHPTTVTAPYHRPITNLKRAFRCMTSANP